MRPELAKYIAHKGSITVDGTSLTVNEVDGAEFELTIVPHTLSETIMADYRAGRRVNLEVDLLARYPSVCCWATRLPSRARAVASPKASWPPTAT